MGASAGKRSVAFPFPQMWADVGQETGIDASAVVSHAAAPTSDAADDALLPLRRWAA